ncbi:hypothetical protein CEP51_014810 [Fusarium floridanum]|uniref:Uncharacterized protein n=1 Tax=Fusarium floridanum TaxID=1325733 RepID=A0A428PLK6_9HYPO|nr:hypothetical protein CEP51_014810 [Fusarium floridanum]
MANDDFKKAIVNDRWEGDLMQQCLAYAQKAQAQLGKRDWSRLAQAAHDAAELLPAERYPEWPPEALRINSNVKKEFKNYGDLGDNFKRFVDAAKTVRYDALRASVMA